jgi:hypothetical protein
VIDMSRGSDNDAFRLGGHIGLREANVSMVRESGIRGQTGQCMAKRRRKTLVPP